MKSIRYIYWQDGEQWLGYLEEYPDYHTQGESLDDLQEHLKELHEELTSGAIPNVRRAGELKIA
jgi:predicted RNase H-like HicB family nuclease